MVEIVAPEVLHPGNFADEEAKVCVAEGQIPKLGHDCKQERPGSINKRRWVYTRDGKFRAQVEIRYRFDPVQLGEGWQRRSHLWLLTAARRARGRWLRWEFDMLGFRKGVGDWKKPTANWPSLTPGGEYLYWSPHGSTDERVGTDFVLVRTNHEVVPAVWTGEQAAIPIHIFH